MNRIYSFFDKHNYQAHWRGWKATEPLSCTAPLYLKAHLPNDNSAKPTNKYLNVKPEKPKID